MIQHKRIGAVAALLMAAAVLATGFAIVNPGALASWSAVSQPAYVSAMDKTKVINIEIVADETQWQNMLDTATAEAYIPATVVINGKKITNVGIRSKGNSSLSTVARDSTTDRYSFKIEFDQYITGQTWLGLDKLALNNMQGDASYMKEYLSYDIMSYAGVESPLYAFTSITVNGEPWGFYLAVECLEESYAQRVYGNDYGILYKPESMGMRGEGRMNEFLEGAQGGAENTERQFNGAQGGENFQGGMGGGFGGMASGGISLAYTDNDTSSYSAIFDNAVLDATTADYKRVIEALEKLSKGEDLENTIDVEAVLKYFAAHTVVVNLDSYVSSMAHNYYLYEEDGKLSILPWDYNLAFGGFQSGGASGVVNFPIDTPVSGVSLEDRPLLSKLLEVPEYLELYHSYLRDIVDGYFNSGLFEQTMDTMTRVIASYVENDPSAFYNYEAFQSAVTELRELCLLRAESIEGQLNGAIPSTSEGQSADASTLVDATAVNLSALGSMGGMGGGGDRPQGDFNFGEGGFPSGMPEGGEGGFPQGGMPGGDRETMQKAIEILEAAGGAELTEEQLEQLHELGLTDEQIEQFRSMPQGGMGGMGGERPQGGFGGLDRQPPDASAPGGENAMMPNQDPAASSNNAADTAGGFEPGVWLIISGVAALLVAGVLFALLFKRRRG